MRDAVCIEQGEQLGQLRIVLRLMAMAAHERQVAPEHMRVTIDAHHPLRRPGGAAVIPRKWSTRSRAATDSSL